MKSCRRTLGLLLIPFLLLAQEEPSAESMYSDGLRYEKQGKLVEAYLLYSQAAAADPKNKLFWGKAQSLRTKAALAAKTLPPELNEVTETPDPDPSDSTEEDSAITAPPTAKDLQDARQPQSPAVLAASPDVHSFSLKTDSKGIWEQVAKAYGIDVVFDGDYQSIPQLPFSVTDLGYREALYALQIATGSFVVPISDRLLLVIKDTVQKRQEIENNIAVTIPIPEPVSLQEAQELARSVQQVMEIQRFAIDSAHRLVFIRDRISKVRPAIELFRELLFNHPEVAVEVELVTVDTASSLRYGFALPTSDVIVSFAKNAFFKTLSNIPAGFTNFLTLGGGGTFLGLGVVTAELAATFTSSTQKNLYHSEVRSVDGMPAQLHVGDKFPILTSSYQFGSPSGTTSGAGFAPTFNFEDLGLSLKITPKVHGMDEVSLEVEAEYKVLGASSVNGIPVIGSRKFKNSVRLRFDEAAIVAGLVNVTRSRSLSGIAGVSEIPIVGALLSNTTRDKSDSQTLLILKPHLLSFPSTEISTRPIWLGSDTRMRIPL